MSANNKDILENRIAEISEELCRHLEFQKMLGVSQLIVPEKQAPSPETVQTADKSVLLEELRKEALQCSRCSLAKTRNRLVFGAGNPDARLMFIGEAPGFHEDRTGEPFVGKAGQLLTKIIQAIGLNREKVYIANILKCRPPGNRNPTVEESINCFPYLSRQLEIIEPEVVVALGGVSGKKLLKSDLSTGRLRGEFHDFRGAKLMVTYHPAYLLRNPSDKRKTWEDMEKVRDYIGLHRPDSKA